MGLFAVSDARPAAAQDPFPLQELSGMTFRPAPGAGNYFMVPSATVQSSLVPPLGLWLDYAVEPVEIFTHCRELEMVLDFECARVGEKAALAELMFTATFTGAVTIADVLQIGLSIPIAYAEGVGLPFLVDGELNDEIPGGSGASLGDPRLELKLQIAGSRDAGWAVGAVAFATAPLAQAINDHRFIGDAHPHVGGHALAEIFVESLRVAIGVGGYYRNVRTVISTEVGPMLSYMLATEWRFVEAAGVLGEIVGATAFDDPQRIDQLEARLGARVYVGRDLALDAGLGVGVILGPGTPDYRLLAGAVWSPQPEPDRDGDGIVDVLDRCPDQPEDRDGWEDEDGCPDADNDRDQLPDAQDRCPNEPEDYDQFADEDGCPDDDNDGDGVRDGFDSCPLTPEDRDGDRDEDGCPDDDRDRDGVPDAMDECPDDPEDTDGLADEDGCPEDDADQDGILDEEDDCPENPDPTCTDLG
jgi:hypothetical protein